MFANLYKKKLEGAKGKEQKQSSSPTAAPASDLPNSEIDSKKGNGKKKRKRTSRKKNHANVDANVDANVNDNVNVNVDVDFEPTNRKRPKMKLPPSQKAIALSAELKSLSTQKRLHEALDLYWHTSNDDVRDEHHACIVIDCCGRSGNVSEGERIVQQLKEDGNQINVQTKTALLKGYAHSGKIREASLLYQEMMDSKNIRDRPNVRTLNTLLRGCLWSAATTYRHRKGVNQIHGGVVTSERVWPSSSRTGQRNGQFIEPDLSSFEYAIILLSQALRVDEVESRIKLLQDRFGITSQKGMHGEHFVSEDPSALETLSVSYISLSRACALLGRIPEAQNYASRVLSIVSSITSHRHSNSANGQSEDGKIRGGKRAWKSINAPNNDETGQQNRRVTSNKLFREHRIHEIESEANMILSACEKLQKGIDLPFFLMTRLLYFNGGGTTDLSAMEPGISLSKKSSSCVDMNEKNLLFDPLWSSFGLATATKENHPKIGPSYSGEILHSKSRLKINEALDFDITKMLQQDGFIDFTQVFSTRQGSNGSNGSNDSLKSERRPLFIELGAGFGEWAVFQAQNNPSADYAAVELRSDRVSQMFTKSMLNESGTPLENICCIGSECGHLLRHRIRQGSVSKIFINHPEPPTQTYGSITSVNSSIAGGGDEPAHMLNSETLLSAIKCLDEATGELIIVTDNRWYANLLCSTLLKVMSKNEKVALFNRKFDIKSGIRQIEEFRHQIPGTKRQKYIHLYEGKPNEAIGHCAPSRKQSGSSYFDRLWRSGAGTHAEIKKRFIVFLSRSQQQSNQRNARTENKDGGVASSKKRPNKNKKRCPEKQRIRNEKRQLKKQQEENK